MSTRRPSPSFEKRQPTALRLFAIGALAGFGACLLVSAAVALWGAA